MDGVRPPALEAVGVSAGYGAARPRRAGGGTSETDRNQRAVLHGIDLAIREGELLAIIGPNGAGKSTLVRVLAGTLDPLAGQVRLAGADMSTLSRHEIARQVAVVEQTNEVALGFSAREVVMMGRAPHQGRLHLSSADDDRIVAEALDQAGISHVADRPVTELSGGEQKLVAVARALAQRGKVLLFDEASAYLDPRHAVALYELAVSETRKRSVACVAVMHDLNLAAAYADRVVLLTGGHVAADGAIEQVMTYARLREAFGVDLYVGLNEIDDVRYFVPRRRSER